MISKSGNRLSDQIMHKKRLWKFTSVKVG